MARWAVITAGEGATATECAHGVIDALRGRGVRVGGFVQSRSVEEEGHRREEIVHLQGGERVELATSKLTPKEAAEGCSMAFRAESFALARRWLEEDALRSQVLVVDSIAKLEAAGEGHGPALKWALRLPDPVVVLFCARAGHLSQIFERFGLGEEMLAGLELPASGEAREQFVRALAGAAAR